MDYPSQLAFDEYLQLMFLPSLEQLSMGRSGFSELFARSALFEALEWLRLGVELEVFTRESAHSLLAEYRLHLYQQCKLYPPELEYLLPTGRLSEVSRMVELTDAEPKLKFEEPHKLSMTFQLLLDLIGRVDAEQGPRSFWTALLFVTRPSWLALESRGITGSEIMTAIQGGHQIWVDGNRPFVYAGYFRVIQHLEDTLELLDHKHRHASVHDWVAFRQAAREIHGWRHNNQKNSAVAARLLSLTRFLAAAMKAEFTAEGGSIEADMLEAYIKDLYDRWDGLALPAVRFAST